MKIVVDTNIVFSALLNTNGTIGHLLFHSGNVFQFYSCAFTRTEIHKHWPKLLQRSKLSGEELQGAYEALLARILFIQEEFIPLPVLREAVELVKSINPDDVDFIALALHLEGGLWTGDKPLHGGLRAAGFERAFNTEEMVLLRVSSRTAE